MKKVLFALAVATTFAACSDSATSTDTTKDSTTIVKDSAALTTPAPIDTTTLVKDSAASKMMADTTKK